MGHQIIPQPDGKLAVFSSITDTWILLDASPEDLLEYYAERAAEDARKRTQQILDHVLAGEPREAYHQFAMGFAEANTISMEHRGAIWDFGLTSGNPPGWVEEILDGEA